MSWFTLGRSNRGHLDERRLDVLARADPDLPPADFEVDHLVSCSRCRSLLAGYRRAAEVLDGAWADRPVPAAGGLSRGVHSGRPGPRLWVPAAALLVVASMVLAGTLAAIRNVPAPGASSTGLDRPAGTGVVATIPTREAWISWSPDGTHLLLARQDQSRVYDLWGRLIWQTYGAVGWLDATHLLRVDGSITDLSQSGGGAPSPNQWS
jgi:hypothetical protein